MRFGHGAGQHVDDMAGAERSPVRSMADSAICTGSVASKVSGGVSQRSQLPQGA
jgi:hypothetical protein